MHFHAEVVVSPEQKEKYGSIKAAVEAILLPYNEEGENPEAFWDWWQIGGGWKGVHVPGYDQYEDPDHKEPCKLCGATGRRSDGYVQQWYAEASPEDREKLFTLLPDGRAGKECNGCRGTGTALKWPAEWDPHPKDIIPVSQIPEGLTCATLFLKHEVLRDMEYVPGPPGELGTFKDLPLKSMTVREILKQRGITEGYLVTVDYHS